MRLNSQHKEDRVPQTVELYNGAGVPYVTAVVDARKAMPCNPAVETGGDVKAPLDFLIFGMNLDR
jgi:hypothetical protein